MDLKTLWTFLLCLRLVLDFVWSVLKGQFRAKQEECISLPLLGLGSGRSVWREAGGTHLCIPGGPTLPACTFIIFSQYSGTIPMHQLPSTASERFFTTWQAALWTTFGPHPSVRVLDKVRMILILEGGKFFIPFSYCFLYMLLLNSLIFSFTPLGNQLLFQ